MRETVDKASTGEEDRREAVDKESTRAEHRTGSGDKDSICVSSGGQGKPPV